MKERFNPVSEETYAKRLAGLKAKGQAIDKFLRTPQTPRQQLVPKGQIRQQGLAKAHQAIGKQRVDISQEINQIQQRLEKQKQQQKVRSR
ncbi:MAG: hypothetical protein L3J04_06245 [Robiginitomaculum sp.]|nr:hypothetical protein [Robiginitomaculum sp.]